uniref:type IX secretion system motor protein PorM/GldM n=1 Tax=Roseivirga sp. TaxID=1964215 RepID=UPI0040484CF7
MAGGKETPRQKMIGMMYLVLTALLALQIKDSVLEKFVLMEAGLETSNDVFLTSNAQVVANIDKAARDQGSKESDMAVVNAAKSARAKTTEIIEYLESVKKEVGLVSSGGDEAAIYERSTLKKYEEPSNYLVEKKNADEMKTKLEAYNAEMSSILGTVGINKSWSSLALDASEIEFYKDNPEEKGKDFANLNFYKTPLAAVLAQVTFYQNQIYARESEALGLLGGRVGATAVKGFDQITGTVLPTSNIVTAGTEFEAEIFLTASNSALEPTMTFKGQPIQVENGRGKIKFKASANSYNKDNLSEQTFQAEIKYSDGGEIKTVPITHTYMVAQPVIEVKAEAIQNLFQNCANVLQINVPSLGPAYNPSFTLTGAQQKAGSKKGEVVVIPGTGTRTVAIGVSSGGAKIGDVSFTVKSIPRPNFKVLIGGTEYNPEKGLAAVPNSITLKLEPDADFAKNFPTDANFFVSKGKILLIKNNRQSGSIDITDAGTDFSLAPIKSRIASGDRLVVIVEEYTRLNYNKEREVVKYNGNASININ